MALSEIDRNLIDRCLQKQPNAWEDFVDRFIGLIYHVARQTCKARQFPQENAVLEDLVQEVFIAILSDNFVVLRRFRGGSSLATYLAIVARRIIVRSLLQKRFRQKAETELPSDLAQVAPDEEKRIEELDEIEYLLSKLQEKDAKIVRMYHLEQRSYAEIADLTGIPANSIGPILSRAREALRERAEAQTIDTAASNESGEIVLDEIFEEQP